MVIWPGNTIHAGGFCFGTKMNYPSAPKTNNEKNTIISDNICLDDFKLEENIIMKKLFKNLLDHHISVVDGVRIQVLFSAMWLKRGLPRNRFILRREPPRNININ